MNKLLLLVALSVGVVLGGVGGMPAAVAQSPGSISLYTASQVRPGQQVVATGTLVDGRGRPVANAIIVLFIRPSGGPDRAVAQVRTDAQGRYAVSGTIPDRPGPNVQISVVSGGQPVVARNGVVVPVVGR